MTKDNARTERASDGARAVGRQQIDDTTGAAAHTARPAIREVVEVPGLPGRFVVMANSDPATITLENEHGVLLRVGERQIRRLEPPR